MRTWGYAQKRVYREGHPQNPRNFPNAEPKDKNLSFGQASVQMCGTFQKIAECPPISAPRVGFSGDAVPHFAPCEVRQCTRHLKKSDRSEAEGQNFDMSFGQASIYQVKCAEYFRDGS
jgi:hypothetical protein